MFIFFYRSVETKSSVHSLGKELVFAVTRAPNNEITVTFKNRNKSLTLSLEGFARLCQNLEEITSQLQASLTGDVMFDYHIGSNIAVQINSRFPGVGIQEFKNIASLPNVKLIPVKESGIFLHPSQWEMFLDLFNTHIIELLPELSTVHICRMGFAHSDLEDDVSCPVCNPNQEYISWLPHWK